MTDSCGYEVDPPVLSSEADLVADATAEFEAYKTNENTRLAATTVPGGKLAAALLEVGDDINDVLDACSWGWQGWVNDTKGSGAHYTATDEQVAACLPSTFP